MATPNKCGNIKVRRTSEPGIDFLKRLEGFREKTYIDIKSKKGTPTIGYGHTKAIGGMNPGTYTGTIKEPQADKMLREDIMTPECAVTRALGEELAWSLPQHQYDALVINVYNTGEGHFRNGDVLKAVKSGNTDEVFKALANDQNSTLAGKKNRHLSEACLYKNGDYIFQDIYSNTNSLKNAITTDQSILCKKDQSSNGAQVELPTGKRIPIPTPKPPQFSSSNPVQSSDEVQVELPTGERIPIPTPKPPQFSSSNPVQSSDGAQVELPTGERIPIPTPKPPQFSSSNPVQSSDGAQVELPTGENAPIPTPKPSWVPVPKQRPGQNLQPDAGTPFNNNPKPQPISFTPNPKAIFGSFKSIFPLFPSPSTEIQQLDSRQSPPNQQLSTQHGNILKRLFNFLRFNARHGGSR